MPLEKAVTTCGRSPENDIAFPDDSNVSRYHAEIEKRGDEYWVIDLGSSNGTTVNGEKLTGEKPLNDGDRVLLGGSSEIEFAPALPADKDDEASAEASSAGGGGPAIGGGGGGSLGATGSAGTAASVPSAAAPSGLNPVLIVAGVVCGLAVICVVAAGIFYFTRGSSCQAKAKITKPEAGDTISTPTEIEVDAEDTGCVSKAVFTIDGVEFASTDSEPYAATIDPKQFADLADGLDHTLRIVLLDEKGEVIEQPNVVTLAFETRAVGKPSSTPEVAQTNTQPTQGGTKATTASLMDVQDMSNRLVKQFHGGFTYNVSNKQFLQEVQKRSAEYAQEGYFDRATAYRDAINVAYIREQNLDAPLGFILAMSRSKFNPSKQGDGEGLWQMSNDFVTANAYNGLCGGESISDPSQNCAAKASALYMKAIVYGVFDGDVVYSAAAFGKSPQDAGQWKASLPQNRSDVWNTIKTAPEREQLVRFFAAGIVTENPQKFGLKKDRPLSELYRVAM